MKGGDVTLTRKPISDRYTYVLYVARLWLQLALSFSLLELGR